MSQNQSSSAPSAAVSPFSAGSLWAALAGAGGGLLSFPIGEWINGLTDINDGQLSNDLVGILAGSGLWAGAIGLTIGAAILIYDNFRSLRGQWHRDLALALPLLFALSFVGGVAGQVSYLFVHNAVTRGIGWALMGAAIGVGVGAIRRDMLQAARGAMGGALGGFIGGFIFDGLTHISDAGGGSLSRAVGQIIMGALIALLMRVVQDALKDAWLLGISTGPYEGKEYPLNTARVSVGRDDSNAIALFREESLPGKLGALALQNGAWFWQGEAITINGVPQENAALNSGDTLQIGATKFRFRARTPTSNAPIYQPLAAPSSAKPANAPTVAGWGAPPNAPTVQASAPTIPANAPTIAGNAPTIRATMPAFAFASLSGQLIRIPACEQPASIGRAPANAIVLADAGVSSRHAQVQWKSGALYLSDLGSTNGTFVNGEKLAPNAPRRSSVGDRIRFGKLDFVLRAV